MFSKRVSFLLAFTAIALASTALSAQAQQAVPGTLNTSAAALQTESVTPEVAQTPAQTQDTTVAQTVVDPGRPTQGGSSYIGVAGNIGLSGDNNSGVGESGFAVISKVGLTRNVSVRPAAVFGDNTSILIPLTYDFTFQRPVPIEEPRLQIAPYLGAGVAINTGGGDDNIGFLATGGIDVPLSQQLTATGSVNATFQNDTDIGILLGVGYNFVGF